MEIIIFIFGLLIGSFLNVVIYRVPRGKSIVYPPSSCPKCNAKIKPHHNIPILGWIILKGRCANCQEKISIRYPIIEFLTGVLTVLVYEKFKTIDIFFIINFAIFSTILALAVIDIDFKAVPDSLNLLALSLSFFNSADIVENFKNAILIIGGMSLLRWYLGYLLKKEAMGEGDLIIAGAMGALLGIKLTLIALFLSALLALIPSLYYIIRKKEPELPYIPFLGLATFIVWFFDKEFLTLWSFIYG